jgi:hypothetical protein
MIVIVIVIVWYFEVTVFRDFGMIYDYQSRSELIKLTRYLTKNDNSNHFESPTAINTNENL